MQEVQEGVPEAEQQQQQQRVTQVQLLLGLHPVLVQLLLLVRQSQLVLSEQQSSPDDTPQPSQG
jgi:hypothetical protein